MPEDTQTPAKPKFKRLKPTTYIAAGVIFVLVATIAVLALKLLNVGNRIVVPASVTSRAKSAIYLPKRLPSTYKIADSSFTFTEEAVLFRADGTDGTSIAFSEQKKPTSFNFDDFYKENITDPTPLKDTPYPAVIGKTKVGERKMLSVVAKDTWVIATTQSLLSDDDFAVIARSLAEY